MTAALLALRGLPKKFDPPTARSVPDTAGALETRWRRSRAPGLRTTVAVRSAVFSPDGARVLTASATTRPAWDTASGQQLRVLRGHEDRSLGRVLARRGARPHRLRRQHRPALGRRLRPGAARPARPRGTVVSAVFSPDGARVLTALRGQHRPALGCRLRPGAARPARPRGLRSARPCSRPTAPAS